MAEPRFTLTESREPSDPEQSMSDRVSDWLTEQLIEGALRPGQWVSENELAAQLGVSRSPVREALRALARDGLVVARPRRGTVITELDAAGTRDIYDSRKIVEPEMTRLAVERFDDADVARLTRVVEAARAAGPDLRDFHRTAFEAWELLLLRCPNRTLNELVALLWRKSTPMRGIVMRLPGMRAVTEAFLQELLAACARLEAEQAATVMRNSLEQTKQTILRDVFVGWGTEGSD